MVFVGLFRDQEQYKRSVALLVAKAFLKQPSEFFDTPINLNGDRLDNQVINLMWRPRWFAIKYNRQFREPILSIFRLRFRTLVPAKSLEIHWSVPCSMDLLRRHCLFNYESYLCVAELSTIQGN